MIKIALPIDRAEPDMAAVALAFGISIKDVHDAIETDLISHWFEVGTGDADDKPHQIFASATLGIKVDVDEHGKVCAVTGYEGLTSRLKPEQKITLSKNAANKIHLDTLLDEALRESFPASDPMAISVPSSPKKSDGE